MSSANLSDIFTHIVYFVLMAVGVYCVCVRERDRDRDRERQNGERERERCWMRDEGEEKYRENRPLGKYNC